MTYRHRRNLPNTFPAYPEIHFHRRRRNCPRRQVPCLLVTASWDAPLIKPTIHRATTLPIFTGQVRSRARRTSPYTSRLTRDRRRNCRATTPYTPAMDRPRLLSRRARCRPLKKWVSKCPSVAYVPGGGIDVASVIAFRAASALFVDVLKCCAG